MSQPNDSEILRIAKSDDWIMRRIWDFLTIEEEKRILEQREQKKKIAIDNLVQNLKNAVILSAEVLDYGNETEPPKLQIVTNKGDILDHVVNNHDLNENRKP